jgi:hypothetical protein
VGIGGLEGIDLPDLLHEVLVKRARNMEREHGPFLVYLTSAIIETRAPKELHNLLLAELQSKRLLHVWRWYICSIPKEYIQMGVYLNLGLAISTLPYALPSPVASSLSKSPIVCISSKIKFPPQ